MEQDKGTRWRKGESGNPAGRRPGSGWVGQARGQLQQAWDGMEEDGRDGIRAQLIAKARDGDISAIRLVAERVCPPIKASEPAVSIELPEGTLTERAAAVLDAVGTGELTPGQAAQLMQAIGALAKVIEVDELTRRIEALEAKSEK